MGVPRIKHFGCLLLLLLATRLSQCASFQKPRSVPLPTADILAWTKREIGAFFSFNMITMVTNESNTQFFCLGVGGSGGWMPKADAFNPEKLDLDNWLQAAVAFGAKYAVLTAQHCSGFSMWPTDISKETGFEYTFSTRYSSFRGGSYDVVQQFVTSCKKHGIQPAIYYSLNQNYYLNSAHGKVLNNSLVPGQVKVSQELYGKIVLAQMRELWTNYGKLSEIWFDGGCSVPGISENISNLLAELQPHAVYFGGCATQNNLRWIGTESGMPGYPIWSTAEGCQPGSGSPNGNLFCPAETDTTLQQFDHWFWRPNFPIRSLSDLQEVYYHSVGQNTNLLLNAPANSSGLIQDSYFARYKEFGEWIEKCFGPASVVANTSGSGYSLKLVAQSGKSYRFNKVTIGEDQLKGESVLSFSVTATFSNRTTGTLLTGQAIGSKFARDIGSTVSATEVVLNVTKAAYEPMIAQFSLHYC